MTQQLNGPPTSKVARAPLWRRAALYAGLGLGFLWLLAIVAVVVWVPIHVYRTWGSWETRRLTAGMACGLAVSLALLVAGRRVRYRLGKRTIGSSLELLAFIVMGLALQLTWYGTPRWNPRYAPLNLLLGGLFWGALGVWSAFVQPRLAEKRALRARLAVKRRELLEQIASFRARKLTPTGGR